MILGRRKDSLSFEMLSMACSPILEALDFAWFLRDGSVRECSCFFMTMCLLGQI